MNVMKIKTSTHIFVMIVLASLHDWNWQWAEAEVLLILHAINQFCNLFRLHRTIHTKLSRAEKHDIMMYYYTLKPLIEKACKFRSCLYQIIKMSSLQLTQTWLKSFWIKHQIQIMLDGFHLYIQNSFHNMRIIINHYVTCF